MVGKQCGTLFFLCLSLLLSLMLFAGSLPAAECVIFGPAAYERGKGAPETATATFSGSPDCSGFVMKIHNGDEKGQRRVSSASVVLNGDEVAGASDFNQQVEWIERQVTPGSANELRVSLAGGPGDFLTITIAGAYLPPEVSLTAAPGNTQAGDPVTLSWTSVHAASCLIDQGVGNVVVSGTATVSPIRSTVYTITATGPGGTATAGAAISVINSAPSAIDDSAVTDEDTPVTVAVLANDQDRDGDALCVTDVTPCAHGTASLNPDGTIWYTPAAHFSGVDSFTYTAGDSRGGSSSASVTVTVRPLSRISLSLTYPLEGELISSRWTSVEGTVSHSQGSETGVSVNGVAALVDGNHFVASHVPLAEGQNTLIASAIDLDGHTAKASVTVNGETSGNTIEITARPALGLSPLEASLFIGKTFLSSPPDLTYTGPGTVEFLTSEHSDEYRVRMTQEGMFVFTIRAEDSQGISHADTVAVQVLSKNELDSRLKSKWQGMKQALAAQDIPGALRFFSEGARGLYQDIYSTIYDKLPGIVQKMEDIQFIEVDGEVAKYRITRDEVFKQQTHQITHHIYFVMDNDGLWKIERY